MTAAIASTSPHTLVIERDQLGKTALHICCALYGKCEHLSLVLKFGADPNALDYSGEAPLHIATRYDKPRYVKILLEAGANPLLGFRSTLFGSVMRACDMSIYL